MFVLIVHKLRLLSLKSFKLTQLFPNRIGSAVIKMLLAQYSITNGFFRVKYLFFIVVINFFLFAVKDDPCNTICVFDFYFPFYKWAKLEKNFCNAISNIQT